MLRELLELTKPKQTLLLMITMYGAYFAGGGHSLLEILVLSLVGFFSISGTTAMNMFLEVDIDSKMPRTSSRPLPSGVVGPGESLYFSSFMFLLGLLIAAWCSRPLALTVLIGFLADILVYTNIVKRRTPYNIVLGGVAGGMPALGGWALAKGLSLGGLILAVIVMAWIPMHIWFIASYFADDYKLAAIPMLPVVAGPRTAAKATEASLLLMSLLAWLYFLLEGRGVIAAVAATAITLAAVKRIEEFKRSPSRETARRMFKVASPIIAAIFVLEAVEGVIGIV